MTRLRPVIVLVAACLAGCPGPEPVEPPHVLYEQDAQSLDNPFPDLRLVTADGMRPRADWYRPFLMPKSLTAKLSGFLNSYTTAMADVRGVGNFGAVLLRTSVAVDPAAVHGVAARLRKVGDGYEVLEADVVVEHSHDALNDTGKTPGADYPEFLVVRPAVPLPEGEEGLLVLKKGLKTVDGTLLGRGFAWEEEEGNRALARVAAAALGVGEDDVLMALPQKAEQVTPPLLGLAQWTVTAPAPAYVIPPKGQVPDPAGGNRFDGTWSSTDGDWASIAQHLTRWSWAGSAADVGQVVIGTFQARELRDAGLWRAEWVADPSSAPLEDRVFVLTLPAGVKPAGGYKVVIGAHGLNGRNIPQVNGSTSFCLEVAEVLAQKGLGCLGIDAPSHGTRGNSFDFFSVEDLRKARDNFRQMAFDQMQLSRLATVLDVDGDGTADLSPELGYFGNSLGGIMGANFMSLDPRVKYGVLNVPGGGLATILTSTDIRDKIGLLLVAKTGLTFASTEYYEVFPLFRVVGQLFLEPGDPVNVAPAFHSQTGRAVLLQEGLRDVIVPNETTSNLARALGVERAGGPSTGGGPVRALAEIDPSKYGKPVDFNGHNIFWELAAARTQVTTFLGSGGTQLVME